MAVLLHSCQTGKTPHRLLYVLEIVLACAVGATLGGWLIMGILGLWLDPRYGALGWYPDFMSVVELCARAVAGGLGMVAVVHWRHDHYHPHGIT